ncbi:CoA ester lyase [Rhizobium sp. FY34]|uniref:HpcH/HpaI aldolase/citrate lyase family protein n=1 Tax=Rhizobium sp. FY34 TaxID=2562309 RepID=UPI0010C05945|nr:CoA ester lyase [Rhizobium sp. FY34]
MRIQRSFLSVPAINQRALDKVPTLECDGVIFDLEDSVAPEKKVQARDNLRRFFSQEPRSDHIAIIRVNEIASPFFEADLALVLELKPDAVLLPKVNDATDIEALQARLDADLAPSELKIWAMMESARGVANTVQIAATRETGAHRLDGFVVGLNDLRKETRVLPRPGRTYLVPYLMQVVLAARAYGLCVIDSVSNDFRDLDGFASECLQGREMGFDGKMLIHPAQIAPANRAFGPWPEEIAEAQAVVTAFAQPEAEKLNVINLDGRMIERLHLEGAEKLLAQVKFIESRKTDP